MTPPLSILCLALLGVGLPLAAQGAQGQPRYRFFDGVVGIIDDQVITASELRPQVQEEIQKTLDEQRKRQPGVRIPPDKLAAQELNWTRHFARERAVYLYQLSQIRELDVPEDALEGAIQLYVERRIEEEIRQAGNNLALIQNLRLQGKTMAEHKQEIRNEYVHGLIQGQQWQRFASGGNLKITPREMWDEYLRSRDRYRIPASARVRVFQLATGSAPETARAGAGRLVEELRKGGDPQALARAHEAVLIEEQIAPDSGFLAFVRAFAFDPAHRAGQVSEPLEATDRPGSLFVVQIVERRAEGWRPFSDPNLQREIQRELMRRRMLRLEQQDERRNQTRIRTWPPDLLEPRGPAR